MMILDFLPLVQLDNGCILFFYYFLEVWFCNLISCLCIGSLFSIHVSWML